MNNKGQALVFVILLIPIIVIILVGTLETASVTYQKNRITSNIKTILTSCFEKCSDDDIAKLFKDNNLAYDKLEITRDNDLQVDVEIKINGIIKDDYLLKFAYKAINNDNKIEIKRVS